MAGYSMMELPDKSDDDDPCLRSCKLTRIVGGSLMTEVPSQITESISTVAFLSPRIITGWMGSTSLTCGCALEKFYKRDLYKRLSNYLYLQALQGIRMAFEKIANLVQEDRACR